MPEQLPSTNPQAMTPLVFVLTVSCCLVGLGCRNDEIGESRQPSLAAATLTAIDSVLLEEAGGAFIAKPADLVVGRGGTLLIPDVGMKRLFEFAADGRSVRSFGHAGSGPGEFVSPGWSTLVADSTILVKDNPALELEAFSLTRGQWMWSRRLPSSVTSGIAYAGDDILVAELNAQSRTSFLRIPLDSSRGTVAAGALPQDAHGDAALANAFRQSVLAPQGSRVAQAFEVSNWILIFDERGLPTDSIHLPVARRKGAPVRLLPLLRDDPSRVMEAVNHVSQPIALAWLSDTILGLVTVDADRTVRRYAGPTYLTVVDTRTRRACVDAVVPAPLDPPPVARFVADTLVLVYADTSLTGAPEARVKRLLIDTSTCSWAM